MLVNDVITANSIALAATEDASNKIAYLGTQWFPERKKAGIDLKWIKTYKGLPVSLAPSNFDALPSIRARKGLATEKTQMAFFREQMVVSETDALEIDRIKDENDPYLVSALQSVYDDTNTLVEGALVVPERMRMSLLATTNGTPAINITSDGVTYAYNYDPDGSYAANHYSKITTAADKWSATTAKPITDLINARKALEKLGQAPKYVLMNSTTFGYLLANLQVQGALLAQNVTPNVFVDDDSIKEVIKRKTKLTIVIYDKMYKDESGTAQNFYPDNKVTLLPEGKLGSTFFGTTPEERSASQVTGLDVAIYGTGIAIATATPNTIPIQTSITASEIVLPSYEGMESTFVIEVA